MLRSGLATSEDEGVALTHLRAGEASISVRKLHVKHRGVSLGRGLFSLCCRPLEEEFQIFDFPQNRFAGSHEVEIGELSDLKKHLSEGDNQTTFVEITRFDETLAVDILNSWLTRDKRKLTKIQRNGWLKPQMLKCDTPLFLSLIYDQTLTWHSYDRTISKDFRSIVRTEDAVRYLFCQLSQRHGTVLFQSSMKYIRLIGGLTENELEDILSLDDDVLKSVFVHYLPSLLIFRLPGTLWIRIKNDMKKYLVEREIDGLTCIYFYHRSFQDYEFKNDRIFSNLDRYRLEYFSDKYQQPTLKEYQVDDKLKEKYRYSSSLVQTNRCLSVMQPIKMKTIKYNLRRIKQLLKDPSNASEYTLCDYEFMVAYLYICIYIYLIYEFKVNSLLNKWS
ncbi:unnamed protein product, partial [Didymodactylos carnosus]